ncbi:MAG: DUF87 domain-containing protein [Candidatus Nanopelagicales bacterium]
MADLRLGGAVDPATHERTAGPVVVPSEDLSTHAVIVGMTGSGKTGLGVVLIEECLRAGVPALLIDPKGDLTNLALTFPNLAPAEFEPWVNASDAHSAGQSVAEFAAAQARTWTQGLAGWDLGAADVAALHRGVEVTIYTPGSPHGVGLNIIGSLDAPADRSDPQALAEEIDAYVSSLLNLVDIDADPLSSREHILLSTIIGDAWTAGRALDLATLVASVQQPPMRKIGVLELDSYYPEQERMKLALRLNGLLASPAFAAWLTGQRIDIDSMLRTPEGAPRCAVITTAHLDDQQRQSATSVILAKLISWMRRQPGTSDLRTLLYMDEVAGYLPPNGNPPTKSPIMLLLKQARAFGVGVVLATQNPVDVDYKALSNTGTWLIGRLQTEQDKDRLVDGLTSAAGGVDVKAVGDTISGLAKREFVVKRASRDTVEVMTTRWAMSYLRGPLTRDQVASLRPAAPAATAAPAAGHAAPAPDALADDETPVAPRVPAGVPVTYLDPGASWAASVGAVPGHRLAPAAIARVLLHFDDAKAGVTLDQEYEAVLTPVPAVPRPEQFVAVDYDDRDLSATPPQGAIYRLPPSELGAKTWWTTVARDLAAHLQRRMTVQIPANTELRLYGRVDESTEAFATRCRAAAQDAGDKAIAALQAKYATKLARAQATLDTAEQAADRQRLSRTTTVAGEILGGLFGGRRSSASSMARRAGTAIDKVATAEDRVDRLEAAITGLQGELDAEVADIRALWATRAQAVTTMSITLARSDVKVTGLGLVWIPVGT